MKMGTVRDTRYWRVESDTRSGLKRERKVYIKVTERRKQVKILRDPRKWTRNMRRLAARRKGPSPHVVNPFPARTLYAIPMLNPIVSIKRVNIGRPRVENERRTGSTEGIFRVDPIIKSASPRSFETRRAAQ